jgi:glycosyltransferase involved in cell wall biosynthesis
VIAASHFSPDAAALASLSRRGSFGVGYVYHLIAGRERNDLRTVWSKADERVGLGLLRRHARFVFVSNGETEAALAKRGLSTVRTDVGIDLSNLQPRASGRRPPRALFLARMVQSKGVLDAVRVWQRVRVSVPDARLLMAGDGPVRAAGMRKAEELGVADVIDWPGFVSDDEKARLLAETSVFLAPSYEEGWGISVAEALAAGLAVAAYRLPTLDELFPDAYLGAPPGDVEGLADAAVRLLSDEDFRAELAARGRTVAERYDISRVAEFELDQILRGARARA